MFSPLLRRSPGEEVVLILQSLPLSSPRYQPGQKTGPSRKEFQKKKKKKKKVPGLDKTREGRSPGVSPLWLATWQFWSCSFSLPAKSVLKLSLALYKGLPQPPMLAVGRAKVCPS